MSVCVCVCNVALSQTNLCPYYYHHRPNSISYGEFCSLKRITICIAYIWRWHGISSSVPIVVHKYYQNGQHIQYITCADTKSTGLAGAYAWQAMRGTYKRAMNDIHAQSGMHSFIRVVSIVSPRSTFLFSVCSRPRAQLVAWFILVSSVWAEIERIMPITRQTFAKPKSRRNNIPALTFFFISSNWQYFLSALPCVARLLFFAHI